MKKTLILFGSIVFFTVSLFAKPIDTEISGLDFTKQMKFGWNLGNTLDATAAKNLSSEESWGQPKTTKEMIKGLAEGGIKTIRIPVSWHNHVTDVKNYTIDPEWMARVKTIVDWALEENMFVILNTHHDNAEKHSGAMKKGDGYYPTKKDKAESEKYLKAVWTQICKTFNNDYDEHLIFESLNEPRLIGHNHEWGYSSWCNDCKDAMECLNSFNQLIVNTIRSSGGNNEYRFIGVPSLACGVDSLLSKDFILPEDSSNRIIAAVHMYTPYVFAMDPSHSTVTFTSSYKNELDRTFNKLYEKFVKNGIPVYIGEMGATNKNNLKEREAWFDYFVSHAIAKNIPSVVWDNGGYDITSGDYSEKYGYYCRYQNNWYFPSLIKKAVKAAGGNYSRIEEFDPSYEYGFDSENAFTVLTNFDVDSWNKTTTIPKEIFEDVKEGSIIRFETTGSISKDKNYRLLSFRNTSWKDLPEFTGSVRGDGSINKNAVTPTKDLAVYYWILSAEDAKILANQDVMLCGNNVNISSIMIQF